MRAPSVLPLCAACVAAAFLCGAASAQTEPASPSRAEVKAQTRAANKARQLAPAGEGPSADPMAKSTSGKTKAERKAETLQARKEGKLAPAGLAGQLKVDKAMAAASSPRTKEERRSETRAANRARKMAPAGEVGEPKK